VESKKGAYGRSIYGFLMLSSIKYRYFVLLDGYYISAEILVELKCFNIGRRIFLRHLKKKIAYALKANVMDCTNTIYRRCAYGD